MPIFSKPANVIESRRPVVVDGDTYYKSDWMETTRDPDFSPTTFLVEQQPNVSLRTHFHRENQFQLFVRGSGTIGRHSLGPVMVHYAGAYSGYGPIVAGPEGLAYFTLRSVYESGSLTMKDHADQMKRGPKRQLHSDMVPVADETALSRVVDPRIDDLIPLQADGVAARLYTLPPNSRAAGIDSTGSAGQFSLVLGGSLIIGERELRNWEHVFVVDEPPLESIAGARGAQVVALQLPRKAAEFKAG
jgi:hypothetical protein